MTAHLPIRTSLQRLESHSLWLALACLNLAYVPVLAMVFLLRGHSADNYLTNAFVLMGTAAWWFISLLILLPLVRRHGDLRYDAQEVSSAAWTPPVSRAQRQRFAEYRAAARGSFATGPALIGLLCMVSGPGLLVMAVPTMLISWLPASLIWLSAANRDAGMLGKDAR